MSSKCMMFSLLSRNWLYPSTVKKGRFSEPYLGLRFVNETIQAT